MGGGKGETSQTWDGGVLRSTILTTQVCAVFFWPAHNIPNITRPREANQASQSELFWKERLEQALARRKEIEGVGQVSSRKDESLDPDSTLNMSSTVESGRGGGHPRVHQGSAGPSEMRSRTQSGEESQKARVYPSESSEEQERLLPPATQLEHHVAGLSLTQIDSSMLSNSMMVEEEEGDDLDDTVVDEVVASQMNASLPFLDNEDEELIDLLGDLAEDAEEDSLEPSCSPSSSTARPTTPSQKLSQLSQATPRSGTKSATPLRTPRESQNHPRVFEEEDDETLEMSQVVPLTFTCYSIERVSFFPWRGGGVHLQY